LPALTGGGALFNESAMRTTDRLSPGGAPNNRTNALVAKNLGARCLSWLSSRLLTNWYCAQRDKSRCHNNRASAGSSLSARLNAALVVVGRTSRM
jgi:hypothetical protein